MIQDTFLNQNRQNKYHIPHDTFSEIGIDNRVKPNQYLNVKAVVSNDIFKKILNDNGYMIDSIVNKNGCKHFRLNKNKECIITNDLEIFKNNYVMALYNSKKINLNEDPYFNLDKQIFIFNDVNSDSFHFMIKK
jgi:hypothetical protein